LFDNAAVYLLLRHASQQVLEQTLVQDVKALDIWHLGAH
jgi:hypothetical protein